jgi:hypothetical protein
LTQHTRATHGLIAVVSNVVFNIITEQIIVSKTKLTIASQLVAADLLIENSFANRAILEQVAVWGYPAAVLDQGRHLQQRASGAVAAQAAAAGTARWTTEQARVAEREARNAYQKLVQIVRAVFPPHTSQRKALDVAGSMARDSTAFVTAATTLFSNAQHVPAINAVLSRYGYDTATLERERGLIVAYQQALRAQIEAKSVAKKATVAQAEALAALHRWTAQYRKVAKVALRAQPELLGVLGLAHSGRRAATAQTATP